MTRSRYKHSHLAMPRQQAGAALVVGLVLMLVLTVLGISGMNTATLELTMVNNAEAHQDAFQAAETGIEVPIGQLNFTTLGPTNVNLAVAPDVTAASTTGCVTTTPVPDIAFSMGTSTGTVQAFHFDVVSTGTGPRGATSTHNQSFYVVGPGGGLGC